jgi:hypothetical protein
VTGNAGSAILNSAGLSGKSTSCSAGGMDCFKIEPNHLRPAKLLKDNSSDIDRGRQNVTQGDANRSHG